MLEVGIEQHGSEAARRAAERAQRLSGDIVGTSMIRVCTRGAAGLLIFAVSDAQLCML